MPPRRELSGMIVPVVTPFGRDEAVDHGRLDAIVDHLIAEGADFVMGAALTGEGLLLSPQETREVWATIAARAHGRAGFVPAVITYRTSIAIELVREAADLGADAVMVAPIVPELYAGRSEADVSGFYEEVAEAVPVPLVLFNYPSLTGVDFTPAFVARLVAIAGIRAIKESTGDSRRVHAIQRLCGDRIKVICGNPSAAFESVALGCDTWITGIMNAAPRSAKRMMRLILDGRDLPAARDIYYRHLLPLVDLMARNSNPTGTIKAAMRARGLEAGVPRRPGRDVRPEDQAALGDWARAVEADERAGFV